MHVISAKYLISYVTRKYVLIYAKDVSGFKKKYSNLNLIEKLSLFLANAICPDFIFICCTAKLHQ